MKRLPLLFVFHFILIASSVADARFLIWPYVYGLPGFAGFNPFGFPIFNFPPGQGFPGFPPFQIPGFPPFQIPGFPPFQIPGFPPFQIPPFQIPGFPPFPGFPPSQGDNPPFQIPEFPPFPGFSPAPELVAAGPFGRGGPPLTSFEKAEPEVKHVLNDKQENRVPETADNGGRGSP